MITLPSIFFGLVTLTSSGVFASAIDTRQIGLQDASFTGNDILVKRDDGEWYATKNRYHLYQSFPKSMDCVTVKYNNEQLAGWIPGGFPSSKKEGGGYNKKVKTTELTAIDPTYMLYIKYNVEDKGHDRDHFRGDIQIITITDVSVVFDTLDWTGNFPSVAGCVLSTERNSTVYTDKNIYFNSWSFTV